MQLALKEKCAWWLMLFAVSIATSVAKDAFRWERLPSIPDRFGFAGPFAGVIDGALIVAGGANFPEKPPSEGGIKVWHDSFFLLDSPRGEWTRSASKMPRLLAYGVSITHRGELLCIGGSDEERHYSDVFSISRRDGKFDFKDYPRLPRPAANLCGALLEGVVYVAGGIESPNATNALRAFWSLDLKSAGNGWRELEPWPGPGRMLSVAGAQDGMFFLFGGAALKARTDGKVVREWLRDGYRFAPGKGWKRIADLPRPVVAAPSPALPLGRNQLIVLGGDDGMQVEKAPSEHSGFSRETLAYDVQADRWSKIGEIPFALVTTPTVEWNGSFIIPGGEVRPGVRSTEVWAGSRK